MNWVKQMTFALVLVVISFLSLKAQISSTHYLPPLKQSPAASIQGQVIYLSTPETTAFDVNVYQGTSLIPITTISISNSAPGVYTPPGGTGANNSTIITPQNAGIVVNVAGLRFDAPSGKQFYLNWRAAETNQGSSLVSLGKSALGTNFKWGGIPQVGWNRSNSVIGIMATEDNTVVKISGYNPSCTFSKYVNGALSTIAITDDSLTINLNAFETYTLESYATTNGSVNLSGWLGANISANKNIAVNQGHIFLSIANGDYSMTQLAPTTKIGKEYVLIRGVGLDYSEFPIVIATKDNTSIYLNDEVTPYVTLNNGQWAKIPSSKYSQSSTPPNYSNGGFQGANMYIRATENIYVFQFISAINAVNSDAAGDVFQVAPLSCFLDNGVNKIPDVLKTGVAAINLGSADIMLTASSAITTNNITIKYGTGGVSTVTTATLTAAKKTVRGTSSFVSYYISGLSGDISVLTNGPVAVSYLGASGVVGVGGYFSGFGTIPTIETTIQNVCLNATAAQLTSSLVGVNYTYQWYENNTAVNTGGTIIVGATASSYTPSTAASGTKYYYVVITNAIGCTINSNVSGAITVKQNTIALASAAGTNAQTLCNNNPITNITYNTTGATNATVSGLPTGVTGSWLNNILTISGTPTVSGTFTYTVSTVGGCTTATATGTLTVTPTSVLITSSASGSGVCAGSLVTFTSSVCNGGANPTFQWFKNGVAITGANSSTYSTTSLADGDQVYVQLSTRVSNSISQSNLILNLDAGNTSSYSGSGNIWNDLSSTHNNMNFFTDASYATSANPEFSIDGGGSLRLNNAWGKTINLTGIAGSSPRTMSAWLKLDDLSPNAQLMNFAWIGTYATGHSFEMMQYYSPETLLHFSNGSIAGSTSLNPNQWYYITISNDGTTSKIYVNGIVDASANGSVLSTDDTPVYIGSTLWWGSLKGKMASLDLYNAALTDQGVLNNYNATKSRFNLANLINSNSITTNINSSSSISLTSIAGTAAQTVCLNNLISSITYSTSGATGATFTGLPTGVTGVWSNNSVTISGTPTVSGSYTYTITLVAVGCTGSNSVTGAITVLAGSSPVYTLNLTGEPCVGQAALTVTTGFTSYTWQRDNVTITGATSNTYTPSNTGVYKVIVSNGVCASTSSATTIYQCGLTADGKMMPTTSTQLVSVDGSIYNGTGLQEVGKILNITNTYAVNIIETPVNGGRLLLNLDARNYRSLAHNANPATWKDLTVSHNDAAIFGTPAYGSSNGGALNFPGGDANYIKAADAAYFSNTSFTIQTWVYPTNNNSWNPIIDFGNGENSNNIILSNSFNTSGKPGLNIEGSTLQANTALSLNAWHFISVTYNANTNTATFYIDGQASGSGTMNTPTDIVRTKCYIGKSNVTSTPKPNFVGGMGAVQIYHGYLNASEITSNYEATKSLYGL